MAIQYESPSKKTTKQVSIGKEILNRSIILNLHSTEVTFFADSWYFLLSFLCQQKIWSNL